MHPMLEGLGRRAWGAVLLDAETYEEVEADRGATPQAALVVVAASLLWAGGLFLVSGGLAMLVTGVIAELVRWLVWTGVTHVVGTRLFKGTADLGQLFRVLGFASAPHALGIIPAVGHVVGALWAVACMVVAVRQALDFTTTRAVFTVLIGWLVSLAVALLLHGLVTRPSVF